MPDTKPQEARGSKSGRLDWEDALSVGRHAVLTFGSAIAILQPSGPSDPAADKAALIAGGAALLRFLWRWLKNNAK